VLKGNNKVKKKPIRSTQFVIFFIHLHYNTINYNFSLQEGFSLNKESVIILNLTNNI